MRHNSKSNNYNITISTVGFIFILAIAFAVSHYFTNDIIVKFKLRGILGPYAEWAIPSVIIIFMILRRSLKRKSDDRRKREFKELALRSGKEYVPSISSIKPFNSTLLYKSVDHGSMIHVLKGDRDLIFIFTYLLRTKDHNRSGASRQSTIYYTVAGVKEAGRNLPSFQLESEGLIEKFAIVFGGQDIDFVEDPEFSKKFRLQAPDASAVRPLFSQPALRNELGRNAKVSLLGEGEWLWRYKFGQIDPKDFPAFLNQTHQLSSLFK